MKKAYLVYFSPTSTTKKVLKKIAEGTGIPNIQEIDFTLLKNRDGSNLNIEDDALVIFGSPVYMGRVQTNAVAYLKQFKGKGQPAVCIAVYGNRDFDDALVEMIDVVTEDGFVPMAAAGFIGEHSFSNETVKIATGRPDESDNAIATNFGKQITARLNSEDLALPEVRGNRPYLKPLKMPAMASKKTKTCNLCLACKEVCPMNAIDENGKCDKHKCIVCFACVKNCPNNARAFKNPMIYMARKSLPKGVRKEPEIFI